MVKDMVIEYEILNWKKYNPKDIGRAVSWFRVEADLMHGSSIARLDHGQFRTWFALLARGCKGSGKAVVTMKSITAEAQTKHCVITASLELLQALEMITYSIRLPNEKVLLRNGTVRNETGRYGTVRDDTTPYSEGVAVAPNPSHLPKKKTVVKIKAPKEPTATAKVWKAYEESISLRYGSGPPCNAVVLGQAKQLVARVGAEDAVNLVKFFVGLDDAWLKENCHPLGFCLKGCESYLLKFRALSASTKPKTYEEQKAEYAAQGFNVSNWPDDETENQDQEKQQ